MTTKEEKDNYFYESHEDITQLFNLINELSNKINVLNKNKSDIDEINNMYDEAFDFYIKIFNDNNKNYKSYMAHLLNLSKTEFERTIIFYFNNTVKNLINPLSVPGFDEEDEDTLNITINKKI